MNAIKENATAATGLMDASYESVLFYFCHTFICFGAPSLFYLDTVASGKKKNNLLAQMEVRK